MKIALISSTFLPAQEGVSITLWERLKKLSELGHSALCLVSSYEELQDIYPHWSDYQGDIFKNIKVITLPSQEWMGVKRERNPTRDAMGIINNELNKFQPDIIQVEEPERLWTSMFSLPGVYYAQKHHIPCLASYRTNFIDYLQDYVPWWGINISRLAVFLLTKWIYNRYSITLVGSKFIYQRLRSWKINNVDYAPVVGSVLVKNGSGLRNNNFFQNFYHLQGIDDTVKILFLGRLSPDKNWRFNCQYLPQLIQQSNIKKFTIIIAGTGELEAELSSSLLGQKLPTVMLGEVPHDRVIQLLANVDFHVTSSLKETFGRTVQESLYAGTPVVAPDCPWARNLITHNFNGLLYQSQNGKNFIQKLTQLINSDREINRLRTNILHNINELSSQSSPTTIWIDYLQQQINLNAKYQ